MLPRVLVPYRNSKKVQPYLRALRLVGVDPHAHLVESAAKLDGFAGLVLMGGTDVNPARYREAAAPETDPPDDQRDEVEFRLAEEALARDVPLLAICRGMQLLNVALKGTLIQHLGSERHDPNLSESWKPAHQVELREGSLICESLAATRISVNSRHHQAVSKVGEGLRVSGRDPETGTVEAIEREGSRYVIGVQWHPEDQVESDPVQKRLFQSFADALVTSPSYS